MSRKAKILLAAGMVLALAAAALLVFQAQGVGSVAAWLILLAAAGVPWLTRPSTCRDFVSWKDEYAIGIEAIDRDHKRLLTLINHMLAAQMCRTGPAFERQALEELVAYTEQHLRLEETLMQEHAYPDFEGHKAQHDQMVTQVRLFVQRYEQQGSKVLGEVAKYLTLWLLQHINGTDRKLAPHLEARGVR